MFKYFGMVFANKMSVSNSSDSEQPEKYSLKN